MFKMSLKILHSKSQKEIVPYQGEFVIDENHEYSVHDGSGQLTQQDFQSIGLWLTPEIGTLKSTNKVGVFRLKNITIRVRSKLGDTFFNKLKQEIATVEKHLLLSTNGIEEQLALTHGQYLEELATSLLLESWSVDRLHSSLRFVFESPNFGFTNKRIVKNISKGDTFSDIDFQYMQKSPREVAMHKGRLVPIAFSSVIRHQTYDVLEMRFVKFFLFFCFNLLEKRIAKQKYAISALENSTAKLKALAEQENKSHITHLNRKKLSLNNNLAFTNVIKVKINAFLRSDIMKNIHLTGDLDFTSLKLHNHFYLKKILKLYLNMRKSFEPLNSNDLVYLDINSLENLYEYYCLIRLLRDFNVKPENIKGLIKKEKSGWIIKKSIGIPLENHNDYELVLYFKRTFSKGKDTYSLKYDPDYTIEVKKAGGDKYYFHLDAKYKHFKGQVKKEDIDKMHTYTHAIKNSKGAVVLFPGHENICYDCIDSRVGALYCAPSEPQNLKDLLSRLFFNCLK